MRYWPKGGMCSACKHKHADCSDKCFEDMPRYETHSDFIIVICTDFEREKE